MVLLISTSNDNTAELEATGTIIVCAAADATAATSIATAHTMYIMCCNLFYATENVSS